MEQSPDRGPAETIRVGLIVPSSNVTMERELPTMLRGLVYRMQLAPDGKSVVGGPIEYFKTTNRYRDLTVAPDQRTFYIITDNDGRTMDDKGAPVRVVANPGAVLEFKYATN